MRIATFQRLVVPALCLAGAAALWAGPTLAASSEKFQTELSGQNQVPPSIPRAPERPSSATTRLPIT